MAKFRDVLLCVKNSRSAFFNVHRTCGAYTLFVGVPLEWYGYFNVPLEFASFQKGFSFPFHFGWESSIDGEQQFEWEKERKKRREYG